MVVVGAEASYVKPITTNIHILGPGQTTDVSINADQTPYASAQNAPSPAKGDSTEHVFPFLPVSEILTMLKYQQISMRAFSYLRESLNFFLELMLNKK